jgi:N-terminal domain of reverse transcriptase
VIAPPSGCWLWGTGRIPALWAGLHAALTWAGESVKTETEDRMNLRGTLDTVMVNGPEDDTLDWDAIDWRAHERNVIRLRRRIFTATRKQDWATVRSLQKLMLGSWSNTLVSVRQVTQRNAGRRTAGLMGRSPLHPRRERKLRCECMVRVRRGSRCRFGACTFRRLMASGVRSVFRC